MSGTGVAQRSANMGPNALMRTPGGSARKCSLRGMLISRGDLPFRSQPRTEMLIAIMSPVRNADISGNMNQLRKVGAAQQILAAEHLRCLGIGEIATVEKRKGLAVVST